MLLARILLLMLVVLQISATGAAAEPRLALVITNQSYKQPGAALANTHRDGDLVKAALEKVGFKVWIVRDTASEGALLAAIGEHVARLVKAGPEAIGFLYYSGHGAADRPDGANYLIPTEAPLTHVSQLPLMAVRLDRVTATLATAGKMSFVVFDACRNVALERESKDFGFKGFAPIREQRGLLVAYATEPGHVAVDQSIYARALAEEIVKPGLEAGQVFRTVTQRVEAATSSKQSPEFLDKRRFDFHFVAGPAGQQVAVAPPASVQPPPPPAAPKPTPVVVPPAACDGVEAFVSGRKRCLRPKDTFEDCWRTGDVRVCGPRMVVIPKGRFLMGTSDAEITALIKEYPATSADWFKREAPEHEVLIGRPFAAGETHVTRGQFAAFVAATGHKTDGGCWIYDGKDLKNVSNASWRSPGFEHDDSHPVVCVNWHDAQAYAAWISKETGADYRLLSEAEAEYVARGVTTATRQPRYYFGNEPKDLCKHANGADLTYAAKYGADKALTAPCEDGYAATAPAGSFTANPFGVKDAHGNVWSWTQDCFVDNYRDAPTNGNARTTGDCASRVLRGGSWYDSPRILRSAHRSWGQPVLRFNVRGFGLARTLLPTP